MLSRALGQDAGEEARRYVETTYCARFEARGWVYADGALGIEAHEWLEESGTEVCGSESGEAGRPAETVPCDEPGRGAEPLVLECALLHHVRRSEVREYVAGLRRKASDVRCDDGTPLDELGAP